MTAVQSIAAVVWSYVLAKVPNNHHKAGYAFQSFARGYWVHIQSSLSMSHKRPYLLPSF